MIDYQKQKRLLSPFCGELTWLDDWREFFNPHNIIPDIHQDIPEQFNCLSRIIIFLILIMYFYYGFNKYVWTLIVLLATILIIYLSCYKKQMIATKENYETMTQPMPALPCRTPIDRCTPQEPMIVYDSKRPEEPILISGVNNNPSLIDVNQAHTWCYPDLVLGKETASVNQRLTGNRANPKTEAIPVIPPPMYEPENWSPNDFVVPWKINDQRRQELYQNGYMTWDKVIPRKKIEYEMFNKYACVPDKELRENYSNTSYDLPADNKPFLNATYSNRLADTMMDTADGYYPDNARYNYPVNVPPTRCMEGLSEYNKNLYSVPLQPTVYTRSQVNQPDASMYNLGISYTQPHLPYKCEMDDRGNMMIDEYDPNQYPSEYLLQGRDEYGKDTIIPRNEIYDPRLTGYGTSYRSYNDPMTGQPRFYYDDVDAHTQYNYITRNKIDFTNFGHTAGAYEEIPTEDIRTLANETFHNNVMKQRTELQYRLMAKNSHREWQQRAAPLNKNNFARAQCGLPSASSYAGPRGG